MVAPPQVVETAQVLLQAADKNADRWAESWQAFVAAVRRSLGVKGEVTRAKASASRCTGPGAEALTDCLMYLSASSSTTATPAPTPLRQAQQGS